MITINNITTHSLSSVTKPNFSSPFLSPSSSQLFTKPNPPKNSSLSTRKRKNRVVYGSVTEDSDVFTVKTRNSKDQRSSSIGGSEKFEALASSLLPSSSSSSSEPSEEEKEGGGGDDDDYGKLISRAINSTIVLAAGSIAVTRLLTIDHDYWQGWTFYEVLRYAPEHNWIAYEEALKTNPVLAKMVISGIVYSLGDWIAQCVEGKPLFEFDRTRVLRSGLVGFTLHGSLSHYYYQFCEVIFPFKDWWVVPAKIAFDQTLWAAVWNSIYFVVLALLRLESPANIYRELKETFWPMLTAGWKLWPFAHLITYGVIPLEQRLLWVDCVELIWVTILSTYSNEKSEARSEASLEANSHSSPENPPEE